jgi:hypothetical protein
MPKASTIELLPDDILEKLQELLRDRRIAQSEVAARINAILEEQGHALRLSKSGVNRYNVKMEKAGKKMRESRQMADMWIANFGAEPQGKLGHLINEMLRTLAFDMTLHLQEGEISADNAPATVKMLKSMALAMQRLEKASTDNVKREAEIRRQALEEAAERIEKKVKGVSPETLRIIKEEVYGLVG